VLGRQDYGLDSGVEYGGLRMIFSAVEGGPDSRGDENEECGLQVLEWDLNVPRNLITQLRII